MTHLERAKRSRDELNVYSFWKWAAVVEWKSFEVRSNSLLFCCSMKIKRIAQMIYQSRKSCRELKSQKCCIKVLLFRDSWVLLDAAGWSWSLGFLPGLVGPGWRQPWWFGKPPASCRMLKWVYLWCTLFVLFTPTHSLQLCSKHDVISSNNKQTTQSDP